MLALTAALADRYRIEGELGRGGMATVYLAHDLRHDRPVALKVLLPELAAALGPERFQREIMLAARLQHPHILTVLDSGEAAGQLWFTMPFVEGESLRDRLNREKQLPVEDALRIVREAALALEYAHHHGVIHRDIKPENLLLTTDGSTLVADFGIARAVGGGEQPLTGTGVAIGTPAYMSPEQASGTQEVDARSDVYAMGCVLFEMLAGEPPYTGPTPQAIMAGALTETPRPIHPMRLAVPESLDVVIAKAMAATPDDRHAGAAEFAMELDLAVSDRGARRPSPVSQVLVRRPLVAALTLGVLMGVGALFAWRRSHGRGDAADAKLVAVLPFENLGAPENEFYTDGITDEIRGRISMLPGVQVMARSSSTPYRRTAKAPQQIAEELGVRYLLTATVRWEKAASGVSLVHVSPELVEIRSGSARIRWQQSFDASLTDQFQVYVDIASRVAEALDVALGDSARRQLAEKPTQNLAAYDAFLMGEEISQSLAKPDPPTLRRAAVYYAQAVALDSGFARSWAQLSQVHSLLYFNSAPTPDEAEQARRAAERALALAPNRAEGHLAMANYHLFVSKDNTRAAQEFDKGLKVALNDARSLGGLAQTEVTLGLWEPALTHMKQAQILDPRSVFGGGDLMWVLLSLRHCGVWRCGRPRRMHSTVLHGASAGADLCSRRRAGKSARSTGAAAQDPVLPLARVAQDRS